MHHCSHCPTHTWHRDAWKNKTVLTNTPLPPHARTPPPSLHTQRHMGSQDGSIITAVSRPEIAPTFFVHVCVCVCVCVSGCACVFVHSYASHGDMLPGPFAPMFPLPLSLSVCFSIISLSLSLSLSPLCLCFLSFCLSISLSVSSLSILSFLYVSLFPVDPSD